MKCFSGFFDQMTEREIKKERVKEREKHLFWLLLLFYILLFFSLTIKKVVNQSSVTPSLFLWQHWSAAKVPFSKLQNFYFLFVFAFISLSSASIPSSPSAFQMEQIFRLRSSITWYNCIEGHLEFVSPTNFQNAHSRQCKENMTK